VQFLFVFDFPSGEKIMSGKNQVTDIEALRRELEMRFHEETEGCGLAP
jgi:hypothetical protein